jgi:hypothetical protein
MVLNPYLDLEGISEYLKNEIKEKSIRTIDCVIEVLTLEESIGEAIYTISDQRKFESVNKSFKNKSEAQCQKIFNKLTQKQKDTYNSMKEKELKQISIDAVNKKKEELEKNIETITVLRDKIDNWLKK